MKTYGDVAQWMLEELKRRGHLYQEDVVNDLASTFGEEFTHMSEYGNPTIHPLVLKEFGKLTKDTVVWVREGRRVGYWRFRKDGDKTGRRQVG